MSQKFQKTIENFSCGHCAAEVVGNGYTNHCPNCLWSKHVDVHPGDRAAACQGLMEPVELTIHGQEKIIKHRCIICRHEKNNVASADDNSGALIALSARQA